MKRTTSNKILIAAIAAVSISGIVSSCQKYNNWPVDETTNRLFSTTALAATIDGVTATLTWKEMPSTNGYVIELSKDSLQFTQVIKTYNTTGTKNADGVNFVIPDLLDPNTVYSARVKGTDTSGTPDSKWTAVAFKTKTEQIMYGVTSADIGFDSVLLKWKTPNAVTHLMINNVRFDISDAEKAAGQKTITGLVPKTDYTAVLYANTNIRGQQSFKTIAKLPTGTNVVLVPATDSLNKWLLTATPGTIFVLLQGTKYSCDDNVILPAGASFTIWGEEGPNKPVIAFNGFTLPASAGTIQFENVDLTGYQYQNGAQTATKRNYIFNQSTASSTSKVVFENCTIRNFINTPFRLQSANAITVDSLIFDRCVAFDCGVSADNKGTYAFIHTNVATGKINNIKITNSTLYNIGYGLILHNLAPSQSVTIENTTINNATGDTRLFIDYNAQSPGIFTMRNIILGKTLSPLGTAKGIRSATAPTIINSYKTADAVFSGNQVTGMTDYVKNASELFTDPTNGIFTFKDNSFGGKSDTGDPRWRP